MLTRILAVAVSVSAVFLPAQQANAAPGPENAEDQMFARLLDRKGLLYNFALEKYQGQRYCKDVIDGSLTPHEAVNDLMDAGGYSFDVANVITSAAMVAYCTCSVSVAQGVSPNPALCRQFETAYRNGEID
jgi:hypothetical protein